MAEVREISLTAPQFELVTTEAQFPAMVAGFGAGKTNALITRALVLKAKYPTCNIAYYLPTFDLVRIIGFPRFEEKLEEMGARYRTVKSQTPLIEIENGGQIIFRTMDSPARIVGYEVADSFCDELDTLKADDAKTVWRQVLARNRQKKPDGSPNTIAVGTTPEGFRFVYETWKKSPPDEQYQLIKASTYSNAANLPAKYIENLISSYPTNLIAAYLEGEFVNLTAGSVYAEFDRNLNGSKETIKPNEPLHIGMDFNVTKMALVVFVMREGEPHAVCELLNVFDTPAAIALVKSRFPGHPIFVYPDASGGARKSVNASVSDIALLEGAGFNVLRNSTNPAVKDRVLSVNLMIHSGGKRRLKVNADLCPGFAEALEKQAYDKNGEPDKASGFDHVNDAAGYFISYRWPVANHVMQRAKLSGH